MVDYFSHSDTQFNIFDSHSVENLGTTILALKFKDGVVIASETRISTGQIVASRGGRKIGLVHNRIAVATSGRSADSQTLLQILKAQLNQNSQELNSPGGYFQNQARISLQLPTVNTAAHIFKSFTFDYKNQLSVGAIVAGWDNKRGPQIYALPKGGLMVERNYATDGSGSLFVLPFLDENYSEDLSREHCIEMAKQCLKMSINRDAASGGLMDIVVITAESVDQIRIDSSQFDYTP